MLNIPNNPIMMSIVMLFIVLLNTIVLSVVMLSVLMLSVIMQSVIMQSVVLLNVTAPSLQLPRLKFKCFKYLSLFLDSRKTGDSLQNDILDKRFFWPKAGTMVQHHGTTQALSFRGQGFDSGHYLWHQGTMLLSFCWP